MSKQDYYNILGITKTATEEEIKTAYRKLASKHHPDKVQGDAEKAAAEVKFKEINEAYENLSDPEKRNMYDLGGDNAWAHKTQRGSRSWSFNDGSAATAEEMSRVFEEIFGGRNTHFGNNPFGESRQPVTTIQINLTDAYIGRSVNIDGHTIHLPKGVRSGTKLYGNGKMYRVDVSMHDRFKRSNDDLLIDVSITAIEAMLGIDTVLEHLDGTKLQFTIPSGIQTGQIVKLSGKGMKNPENDRLGDLLVRVSVNIPRDLSDEDKTTLKLIKHRTTIDI